jgi:hypothetical protein
VNRLQTTLIFLFPVLLSCTPHHSAGPFREKIEPFLQTAPAKKLSPALQRRLLALEEKNAAGEKVDLLLGLNASPTENEKGRLQQEKVLLRSVIGTVATATAPAGSIPAISRFDFIKNIELAVPLNPKGDRNEKP